MKKFMFVLACLAVGGCAETSSLYWHKPAVGQISSQGNQVMWNLEAENRGMYLFNLIPLWSGYPTRPNRHEYKLMQNTLNRAQMRIMLDLYLEQLGADKVEDVEISETSSGAFSLWIIWRRTMKADAVAVKNTSR